MHHAEAIERNKGLCDRRPTCSYSSASCASHYEKPCCYTTYVQVSPGYISHVPFTIQNLPFLSPRIHFSLSLSFFISIYFPLLPSFPSCSLSSCPSLLRSVFRGLQVQEVFLSAEPCSSSWSQTKHRKKMCPSVLLVVCMHMHGCSSVRFCSSFVRSPSSLRCLWQECNVLDFLFMSLFLHTILLFRCPAIYDATQELQRRMGRETVLSFSLSLFKLHPSIIHPLLLFLIHHPHLPLDPGVWWGRIVAGLIVELAVGPRGWVEVYIVAGGLEALQVHVEVTLWRAPGRMNLVLVEGLVLVVDAVGRGRILERRVGLWRQALRRDL